MNRSFPVRAAASKTTTAFLFVLALAVLPPRLEAAEALPAPTGKVLLTVDGNIDAMNVGDAAQFDRDMLEAIGLTKLDTKTPWEEGVVHFEGPLFSALLDRIGAKGETLILRALDGYQVDVPMSDVRNYRMILAMKRGGKWMGIRNKGPIWVIYPLDDHPEINNEIYSSRSIWQLDRITVQ